MPPQTSTCRIGGIAALLQSRSGTATAVQASEGRRVRHDGVCSRPCAGAEPFVEGQRLRYDLIHVIVTVGPEPPSEFDPWRLIGQGLVALIQQRVFRLRNR